MLGIAKDVFSAQNRVDTVILDEVRRSICAHDALGHAHLGICVCLLVLLC